MSKPRQLRTCLNLMTTRQNSCLSPPKQLSISITYLLQSLSAMLKFHSNSLWGIWVLYYCHLTMNGHVSNIARTCYFELRRLASIRRFMTSTATATLVSAFVLSRIDYCNSLLFGSTHDVTCLLQRIQNYAARVILRLPKSSSITTHLKSLHWLPAKVRSTYKIDWLCYYCHSSTAPSYVAYMLQKSHHTHATLTPDHMPCLISIDLHTVRQHMVIAHFLLLPLLSGNFIPNDVICAPSMSSSNLV